MKKLTLFCLIIFINKFAISQEEGTEVIDSPEGIVGGSESLEEEYPWMCSIILDIAMPGCGASLIRPQWVLTAGHCELSDFGITSEKVLINSLTLDLDGLAEYSELIEIEEFIVHDAYSIMTGEGADIALIRLSEPSTITPIELAGFTDSESYEHGDEANVLGWGLTSGGGSGSDVLLHANCRFFGDSECQEKYDLSASDPSYYDLNSGGNVCAGYFDGEAVAGAASGDSGGPLFFENIAGEYTQVGVVSGGELDITTEEFPGVFTLVPAYVDWIENTIADYELAASLAIENRENVSITYFAGDHIEINGLDEMDNYVLNVFDVMGNFIQQGNMVSGSSSFEVDVRSHASGVYVIQVLNQTKGVLTVDKFVVD